MAARRDTGMRGSKHLEITAAPCNDTDPGQNWWWMQRTYDGLIHRATGKCVALAETGQGYSPVRMHRTAYGFL